MLKKIAIGFLVVVAGFLAFVASRPANYHVERTVAIGAPAQVAFDQVAVLKTWRSWSPWDKLDPNVQMTYEGPERGIGSSYSWKGNDDVGAGKLTTTESNAPSHLGFELQFIAPFESTSKASFDFKPSGSGVDASGVNVTWSMDGESNFVSKLFGTFVSMDAMIGKDFDKGLGQLKTLAETEAKKQEAERAAAAAQAAAAAAQAAAAVAQAAAAQPAAGTPAAAEAPTAAAAK